MSILFFVIFRVVFIVLQLVSFIMFVGAICSWIPGLDRYKIVQVINMITGVVVNPVRRLFMRLGFMGGPIDLSYLISFFLVEILAMIVNYASYSLL